MKKHLIYLTLLFISNGIFAQVGINTENPRATLDVVASMNDGNIPPGFIAPRLTRSQLIEISDNYGKDQTGAIVYITDLGGAINQKTTNITSIGYYYFNGTIWLSINQSEWYSPWFKIGTNSSSKENTDNSYLNAQVVIGGNSIASINGGTDNAQLTINGGDASINGITVGKGGGSINSNTAIGTSALKNNKTGTNNTSIGANAGTNITTGSNNLMVGSNVNTTSATSNNQMNIGNTLFGITGNSNTDLGRVSIGKTVPDSDVLLDVNGKTQVSGEKSFRYVDGKQANNKVLVSDTNGNASWEKLNIMNEPMYPPAYSDGYTGELKKGIASGILITIPPYSVWIVELGQIVRFSRYLKVYTSSSGNLVSENIWVRFTWSDTPTGDTSKDILAGRLISGSCYVGGEFNMISGTSVIQNSSAVEKKYYLTTDNINQYFIDPSSPIKVEGLFQNWSENTLVVIPANNQSLDPNN